MAENKLTSCLNTVIYELTLHELKDSKKDIHKYTIYLSMVQIL